TPLNTTAALKYRSELHVVCFGRSWFDGACVRETRRRLLAASEELAKPAARAVGALRERSREGAERLRAPETGLFLGPATLTTVKNARANIANVIMLVPSLPMTHFVVIQPDLLLGQFKASSTCHRMPAARTICCKFTDSGEKTK